MNRLTRFAVFLSLTASTVPALAQEAAYIDDRSDGPALIRSLYNAINRKEFARAYSYFGDQKPGGDYETFVGGYAGTVDVELKIGTVTPEGAAGSVYSPVPVAIKSTRKDGTVTIFAGCYVTRLINPAIQEPPFTPLTIDSAALEETKTPFDQAVPKVCHSPS